MIQEHTAVAPFMELVEPDPVDKCITPTSADAAGGGAEAACVADRHCREYGRTKEEDKWQERSPKRTSNRAKDEGPTRRKFSQNALTVETTLPAPKRVQSLEHRKAALPRIVWIVGNFTVGLNFHASLAAMPRFLKT